MEISERDNELVVSELQTRLKNCVCEADVLRNTLGCLGVEPEPSDSASSSPTQHTASVRVRSLEGKVKRLEDALSETVEENQRIERNYFAARREMAAHKHSSAGRKEDLASLRYDLVYAPHDEGLRRRRSEGDIVKPRTQIDLEKAIKRIFKLNKTLKRRTATLEKATEEALQREEIVTKLEADNIHLKQSVDLLQKKLNEKDTELLRRNSSGMLFTENSAQFDLAFTKRFELKATDDTYIEALLKNSHYSAPLSKLKDELSKLLCALWAKQDTTLSTLWRLVNSRTSFCPKKEAHKAISETQRKTKVDLNTAAREVNAALRVVMDLEKQAAKQFVVEYEVTKALEKEHIGVMCVMPDPPVPIIAAQQVKIASFGTERTQLTTQIHALEENVQKLTAENNALYAETFQMHTHVYHSLKSIWTHRYRFSESVEDYVRSLSMKLYPRRTQHCREDLERVHRQHHTAVNAKDAELLDTLAKYLTSDLLYKKDMVVEARVAKEVDARRRNSAPTPTIPPEVTKMLIPKPKTKPRSSSVDIGSEAQEEKMEGWGAELDGVAADQKVAAEDASLTASGERTPEETEPLRFAQSVSAEPSGEVMAPKSAVVAWEGAARSSTVKKNAARGSPANYIKRERGVRRHSAHQPAAGGCFVAGGGGGDTQHRFEATASASVAAAAAATPRPPNLLRCASISFEMGVAPQAAELAAAAAATTATPAAVPETPSPPPQQLASSSSSSPTPPNKLSVKFR